MATQYRTHSLPRFVTNATSADATRRDLTDGPLSAARQAALVSTGELVTFLSLLPNAFIDSQRRELGRLQRAGGKDDRAEWMRFSIELSQSLATTAGIGQRRVERLMVALSDAAVRMHGFVSDEQMQPLRDLTVRMTIARGGVEGRSLSAKTGEDGYFSIALSVPNLDLRKPLAAVQGDAQLASIEILDQAGGVLHRDPSPVRLVGSSIYREYVVGATQPPRYGDPVRPATPKAAAAAPKVVSKSSAGKSKGRGKS